MYGLLLDGYPRSAGWRVTGGELNEEAGRQRRPQLNYSPLATRHSSRGRLRARPWRRRIARPRSTRRHQDANPQQDDDPHDDPHLGDVQQVGGKREPDNQDDESDEVRRERGHDARALLGSPQLRQESGHL